MITNQGVSPPICGATPHCIGRNMSFADDLLKIFRSTIEIDVGLNEFTFTCKTNTLRLETFIDIDDRTDKEILISVGGDPKFKTNNLRINLFNSEDHNGQRNKCEYLEVFFKYAFKTLIDKKIFIRPKVIFKNVNNLNSCLAGYQAFLLEETAIRAGAMECTFE